MSNQHPYTNNGFNLTTFHDSIDQQFHQSVSDYAETEMHWCSQCSNFDKHLVCRLFTKIDRMKLLQKQ